MPERLSVRIEDLKATSESTRFLACVALPEDEPGLGFDSAGSVVWRDPARTAVTLWADLPYDLRLRRRVEEIVVRIKRAGRMLRVPSRISISLLDQDVLELAGRTLKVHIHGVTRSEAPPRPVAPEFMTGRQRADGGGSLDETVPIEDDDMSGLLDQLLPEEPSPVVDWEEAAGASPRPQAPPPPLSIPVSPSPPAPPPPPEPPAELRDLAHAAAHAIVSEIATKHATAVEEGRRKRDVYRRLIREIEEARREYWAKVPAEVRTYPPYFEWALEEILAGGDWRSLGRRPQGISGMDPKKLTPDFLKVLDEQEQQRARTLAQTMVRRVAFNNKDAVEEGRKNRDLYKRLRGEIEEARARWKDEVAESLLEADSSDYFEDALVTILAGGDPAALGSR